jgi:hypothetical protein
MQQILRNLLLVQVVPFKDLPLAACYDPPTGEAMNYEPPPLKLVARLSWYPWLVVGTTCMSESGVAALVQ